MAPSSLDPVVVATEWVRERVPEADLVAGEFRDAGEGTGAVLFQEGKVRTEVLVRRLSDGEGWGVVGAASDMIPLFDVTYDGHGVNGGATVEAAGTLTVTYLADDTREIGVTGPREVRAGEGIELGMGSEQPGTSATVRAVLVVDGVSHLSEVTVGRATDPPKGSSVAVWPATDSVGLARLQRQADAGERPDLLDPQEAAKGFLAEALGGYVRYEIGEFQQGDNTSGEVPYGLGGGASGTVLLRRTGGEGSIWYVTGVTSDDLRIERTRREETHLVADVWSDVDGTLTWTGAPPVEVRSGRTVSIAKPDVPLGDHPVVVRLVHGDRTLAIAAGLG